MRITALLVDWGRVSAHVLDHFLVYLFAAIVVAALGVVWHLGLGALNRLLGRVPIHGNWETQIDRGAGWQPHEKAALHQFINRVWGTATYKSDKNRTYRLRGEVCGQTVNLLYRQSGTQGFDSGAIALYAKPEGEEMEGFEVGYDKDSDIIKPRKYKWTRK